VNENQVSGLTFVWNMAPTFVNPVLGAAMPGSEVLVSINSEK